MPTSQVCRVIAIGSANHRWFARTDDGDVTWVGSRLEAVDAARQWAEQNRPANALLVLAGEVALLFSVM